MVILIDKVRKSKGLTYRKLSELSGIPKSTLRDLEIGVYSPRLDQLEKIAKAANVRITDLFNSVYK